MKTTLKDIKDIREGIFGKRARASDATRAKLSKPYDRNTAAATKRKVKNAKDDLNHIAWQFENQFEASTSTKQKVIQKADSIMKELEDLHKLL